MKLICAIFAAAVVAAFSSTAFAGHRGHCHGGFSHCGSYHRHCFGGSSLYFGGYGSWWYPSYYRPAYRYYPYYYAPYGYSYYRSGYVYGHQTRSLASDVQLALARRGYYDGMIDGIIGPRSRQAISNYQAEKGLPVTGTIDAYLLRSLRLS
jgi:hypothetical protein